MTEISCDELKTCIVNNDISELPVDADDHYPVRPCKGCRILAVCSHLPENESEGTIT